MTKFTAKTTTVTTVIADMGEAKYVPFGVICVSV